MKSLGNDAMEPLTTPAMDLFVLSLFYHVQKEYSTFCYQNVPYFYSGDTCSCKS